MSLDELLKGIKILKTSISLDEEVNVPSSDSRRVVKNGIFVAIKGQNRDGNDYIAQALELGAKCVITDDKNSFEKYKSCILVENSRLASSYIWSNFYKKPSSSMKMIGITGTNGKTSCAYFLYSILKSAKKRVGLISTVECLVNDDFYNSNGGSDVLDLHSAMTTPDPEILYSMLAKMRDEGIEYVVMEASSHSLELFKLAPIAFTAGIFTNLSSEHLDFHKNMSSYFNAKKRLFSKCDIAIINADDDYGRKILEQSICKSFSVSMLGEADFMATDVEISHKGSKYALKYDGDTLQIECNICGEFSVYNSMLALACALKLDIGKSDAINGILSLENISGRLERICNEDVFIDYAHTPYAIENVLKAIRKLNPSRHIIALFGCGGDRDKGKRAEMGKIASELADTVIITSDNSRTESPIEIIIDILKGIEKDNFLVIPNRKNAIERAIKEKKQNDIILLLGKGHERYEIDKNGKHYFSEKDIVKDCLNYDKNKPDNNI